MEKRYVLDTSAIISGRGFPGEMETYIPHSVLDEIEHRDMYVPLIERSIVISPSEKFINRARRIARETGDIHKLSRADMDVVALCIQLGAIAVTDDYAIQNVLKHAGLEFLPLNEKGIREEYRWVYRCKGCLRFFREYHEKCPYCGSDLKLVRRKIHSNIPKKS